MPAPTLTIHRKLAASFALIVMTVIACGAGGIYVANQLASMNERIIDEDTPLLRLALELDTTSLSVAEAIRSYQADYDRALGSEVSSRIEATIALTKALSEHEIRLERHQEEFTDIAENVARDAAAMSAIFQAMFEAHEQLCAYVFNFEGLEYDLETFLYRLHVEHTGWTSTMADAATYDLPFKGVTRLEDSTFGRWISNATFTNPDITNRLKKLEKLQHAVFRTANKTFALSGKSRQNAFERMRLRYVKNVDKELVALIETFGPEIRRLRQVEHEQVKRTEAVVSSLRANAQQLKAIVDEMLQASVAEAEETVLISGRLILVIMMCTVVVAAVVGYALARNIAVPLRSATLALRRMAEGDLSGGEILKPRGDEIGGIVAAAEVLRGELIVAAHLHKEQHRKDQEALDRERELSGLQRQFVSMVSHEFRTPLAVIDGNAQRLLRRPDAVKPERLERALGKIRVSVRRLTDLMESVLAAARLEDGRIKLDLGACPIVNVINEVSASYRELNPDRQILLDIGDLPEQITADSKLIRQVVSNLISNAIKYSPGAPRIWIKGFVDDLGHAVVAVRDEGVGIPLAEQEKLFHRFFRASTSTGITGSGIGLHLASHLVQMHDGWIDFESAEGEGTTFRICLPIAGPGDDDANDTQTTMMEAVA